MILYPEAVWEADMARAYGLDLRRRVIDAIDGGLSARGAAARFAIGISTAIAWHRQWRDTGTLEPGKQGKPPGSKLDAHEAFIRDRIEADKDIACHELAEALASQRGVSACAATVWYFLSKHDLTHKKRPPTRRNSSVRTSSRGAKRGSTTSPTSTRSA